MTASVVSDWPADHYKSPPTPTDAASVVSEWLRPERPTTPTEAAFGNGIDDRLMHPSSAMAAMANAVKNNIKIFLVIVDGPKEWMADRMAY